MRTNCKPGSHAVSIDEIGRAYLQAKYDVGTLWLFENGLDKNGRPAKNAAELKAIAAKVKAALA